MNAPTVFSLERLSLGVSRLSIRHGSTAKRYKQPRPDLSGFEPGHGEQIWIFKHFMTNQVLYSHKSTLKSNKALRQMPYNGKKCKPAKLRRDYWRPMALIQFAQGSGDIGMSVFQKLRELRQLHEISWGWQESEIREKKHTERGPILNDQHANTVADVAAVLAGQGRGNRIWNDADLRKAGQAVFAANAATEVQAPGQDADAAVANTSPTDLAGNLAEATIYWANTTDREWAEQWSSNVTHALGLPRNAPAVVEEEDDGTAIPPEPTVSNTTETVVA